MSHSWFFLVFLAVIDISLAADTGDIQENQEDFRNKCTMENCFDLSKCRGKEPRKVFIHPYTVDPGHPEPSPVWRQILQCIRESDFYTEDPSEACLFVLGIDTTDRDRRSANYVPDVDSYIANLPQELWNDGRNHIIFNFYHGTFPDYADHNLGFYTGQAIIARASPSFQSFRECFDISFPLFHENHPYELEEVEENDMASRNTSYLVSFKGKRYVYGIGSGTRNLVHHLHNGKSIIMVTTCKHNNDWQVYQDDRCQSDNEEYEKWDYDTLLKESTFCLVPRGRRLGSFRFLETLRAGCIPVVISDDWVLPYSEIIDWSEAALVVPERLALTLPEILMTTGRKKVDLLKQKTVLYYRTYLQSITTITRTAFEIIFRRLDSL
ncbi:unnamed protein product [Caenorhabditis auriculariae]|uniref:Exostosin GT47 domain-containing protein n=1 Tax=Caenorhabditis auriculariae TaxID=2777116 RepID=A0A8S1H937_9PELO|nr:unnamed protein product [Caenorhabditis auriculariae]